MLDRVTSVDHPTPLSAYVALDTRLPHHPDRDVALLWDEERGWAAATPTGSRHCCAARPRTIDALPADAGTLLPEETPLRAAA